VAVIFQGQSSCGFDFATKQATTNDPDCHDFGWRFGAGQTGDDQELATPPRHRIV
jgi:hypothetical protein